MTQGIIIYAHNSRDVDYAKLAIIAGGLAKKNLNRPVSLITDKSTIKWMKESGSYEIASNIFDKFITTEKPDTINKRTLFDGSEKSSVAFLNTNRSSAYDLSPYDQTLLIDSDYLVLSNELNKYWDLSDYPMISSDFKDAYFTDRRGYHDRYISDTGVKLYWATTLMFNKNDQSRLLFDTVTYIRNNYEYFGDLYRFHPGTYRNDIAFSIAKHTLNGFSLDFDMNLPPVLSSIDKDILASVETDGRMTIYFSEPNTGKYVASSFKNIDLHIMNKQSIIRHYEKFISLL